MRLLLRKPNPLSNFEVSKYLLDRYRLKYGDFFPPSTSKYLLKIITLKVEHASKSYVAGISVETLLSDDKYMLTNFVCVMMYCILKDTLPRTRELLWSKGLREGFTTIARHQREAEPPETRSAVSRSLTFPWSRASLLTPLKGSLVEKEAPGYEAGKCLASFSGKIDNLELLQKVLTNKDNSSKILTKTIEKPKFSGNN